MGLIWKLDFAMRSFQIATDEPCELCNSDGEYLVVTERHEVFGVRRIVCEKCEQELRMQSIELERCDVNGD